MSNPYAAPKSIDNLDIRRLPSSLKPAANLRGARGSLLIVGSLLVVMALFAYVSADDSASMILGQAVRESGQRDISDEAWQAAMEQASKPIRLNALITMIIGSIPLLGGWMVYRFPLTATIAGGMVYVLFNARLALVEPASLMKGWWLKSILLTCLLYSIMEAVLYRKRLRAFQRFQEH